MSKVQQAAIVIVVVILGAIIGWYVKSGQPEPSSVSRQIRIDSSEYKFINPLLFSDNPQSTTAASRKIALSIDSYISDAKDRSLVDSASVYFRDLNTGQWTGVNEDALYKPSSMLKALTMMAVFKISEQDTTILSKKLNYKRSKSDGVYYEGDKTIKDGLYPVSELVGVMVQSSDNDAFQALVSDKEINDEFVKTYSLLRLPLTGLTEKGTDFMSPKSYATLFRTLYNSTFFSWHVSEQVLDLLSKTNFDRGLVAGVPSDIVVAHKFGENTDQLHDCGIIYYPRHPYLLCVMTKAKDLSKAETTIAGISKKVFEYVKDTYPE